MHAHTTLASAVQNAWHVIECVPEDLRAKHAVFADLAALTAADCILATNSSSFRSARVAETLPLHVRARVLNTHYFMSPHVRAVELMTCGCTAGAVLAFLGKRLREVGLSVYTAQRESTGFIQNRVWAAVKREVLAVVAEGVAEPGVVDEIFFETVVKPGLRPFVAMDRRCACLVRWGDFVRLS